MIIKLWEKDPIQQSTHYVYIFAKAIGKSLIRYIWSDYNFQIDYDLHEWTNDPIRTFTLGYDICCFGGEKPIYWCNLRQKTGCKGGITYQSNKIHVITSSSELEASQNIVYFVEFI